MKLKFVIFRNLFVGFLFVLTFNLHASDKESIGPYGGRFRCISISKSNPEVMYTGTYFGGMYKSTDYGDSWEYLGLRNDGDIITSIAIDCTDPNSVYYCYYSSITDESGAFKSNYGGLTWEQLFASARVVSTSLLMPRVMFVGNNNGFYKSTDGGNEFIRSNYEFGFNNFCAVQADPVDPYIIYVGTDDAIYKSTDSGDTWIKLRDVFQFSTYPGIVNDISISPVNNNIISVATIYDGLLISTDGGLSWFKKDFGVQVHGTFCDNTNENIICAAHLSGFEMSNDLGQSFHALKDGRFKAAEINECNFYVIEEYEGTILKSSNQGITWEDAINGISNVTAYSGIIVDDKSDDLLSIVSAGYNGKLIKYNGDEWETISSNFEGGDLYRNPGNQHLYFLGDTFYKCENNLYQHWEFSSGGLPYCLPQDIAINNDDLYLGCTTNFEGLDAGIYKSTDEGNTWFISSEGLPLVERSQGDTTVLSPIYIYSICLDPDNTECLYAAGYQDLFKSTNSGAYWSKICSINKVIILEILVDPVASNILYVMAGSVNDHMPYSLYKSTDSGVTFTKIDCGLPLVYCLFYDDNENILYAGGKDGIVRSADRGLTWENIGEWNNETVSLLAKRPGSSLIYAGTKESGVYKINLTPSGVEQNSTEIPSEFKLEQNYPNPFNPETVISWQLAAGSKVTLNIYDVLGREIATFVDEFQEAGIHHSTFSTQHYSLPSGVYFYQLKTNNFIQTKKMVLLR
ncbi:MAG: T9SS type A sorting domain-containing protein [bacterium]